jgi:hypothetical protein
LFRRTRRAHYLFAAALFGILGFHVGVWAVQLAPLAAGLRLDPAGLGAAFVLLALAGSFVTLVPAVLLYGLAVSFVDLGTGRSAPVRAGRGDDDRRGLRGLYRQPAYHQAAGPGHEPAAGPRPAHRDQPRHRGARDPVAFTMSNGCSALGDSPGIGIFRCAWRPPAAARRQLRAETVS